MALGISLVNRDWGIDKGKRILKYIIRVTAHIRQKIPFLKGGAKGKRIKRSKGTFLNIYLKKKIPSLITNPGGGGECILKKGEKLAPLAFWFPRKEDENLGF